MTKQRTDRYCPAAIGCCLLALAAAGPLPAEDGVYTQTFELRPGWNSIFVEVQPEPADVENLFAGVPIESVWGWFPPPGGVTAVPDPGEGLRQLTGWRGFFPRPRPEALLTNLFALEANRAYLVKLGGAEPVTVTVAGKPVIVPLEWQPDSFNLVGFHVDSGAPPSFGAFLASSDAHAGQPVYRLDPAGFWQLVDQPYSTAIRSGEAYWIFTTGTSTFQGPLEVATDAYEGLEFSASIDSQRLTVRNRSLVDVNVRLRLLSSASPVPLALETVDDIDGAASYPDLPGVHTVPAVPGQVLDFGLGVRRAELIGDRGEQLLEVTNGIGSRWLVFVGATQVHPSAAFLGKHFAGRRQSFKDDGNTFAGLWVGTALVNKVSEAQQAGDTPVPTGETFPLRFLIHVDGDGTAQLLKEVIQMWKDGITMPCEEDPSYYCTDAAGRYVLVTDESKITEFSGATLRDGRPVGLRYSMVAYDFDGTEQVLNGTLLSSSGSLNVALEMTAASPTHPYKHKYHPDHDNLDANYAEIPQSHEQEIGTITRSMTLDFQDDVENYEEPPGWGDSLLGGIYEETISGMHKNDIYVEGVFLLERVTATPELNQ